MCNTVLNTLAKFAHAEGVNGVKCSNCFRDKSIFVNMVLTKFEKNKTDIDTKEI